MNVTLAIDHRVGSRWVEPLSRLDDLELVEAPIPGLIDERSVRPLEIREVSVGELAGFEFGSSKERTAALLLLVEGVVDENAAASLEDAGIGFVDSAGRAWVPGTRRSRQTQGLGTRTRAAAIRAIQRLADHPTEPWTELKLAEQAQVSAGTAHKVMRQLIDAGLLKRTGAKRGSRTDVSDIRGLRRWLLDTAAHQGIVRLPCYVRDLEALPAELDGLRLVHSGTEAAARLGLPVVSGSPRPLLRIAVPDDELEDVPSRLRGIRTTKGANLLLVADSSLLGANDARQDEDGRWLAPPSRIAIDMLGEPRGDAAAAVFMELWGDQVL